MEGPRSVKRKELESAVRLADAVFRRDGTRRSMGEDYPLLFAKANLENLRAYIDNGEVISLVGTFFRDIIFFGHRIPAVRLGSGLHRSRIQGKGPCDVPAGGYGALCSAQEYSGRINLGGSGIIQKIWSGEYRHFFEIQT
jgi:hypothetical protein